MYLKKFSFLLVFFLICGQLFSQVPEGGIRLNAESGTIAFKVGNCEISETVVTGQDFTEGFEFVVGAEIINTWDAQVKFPSIDGIETDDVVLVAFYARTLSSIEETGEGRVNVIIENNSTYAKELSHNITIGNEWTQYYAPAEIANTLASTQVSYLFHCGFPSQTIEIADIQFLNYKQTLTVEELPQTEITYSGQAPDAAWRASAAERIEQIRKGSVDFVIYDEAGLLLENATIEVEMVQHLFGFGTAIGANRFNSDETYRNKVTEMFNEVVFENDLKWPQFEGKNHSNILKAMDTLDAHNIPIRGHNIIWPSWDRCPSSVQSLSSDPVALTNRINEHFDDVGQFTKGRLNDWYVMNEPYSEHDIQDILGDEVMADWFKRARVNDRNVKLYINDYSIISAGGKNTVHQDYYYDVIEFIEENGGAIDGIGLQGHMSSEMTPITKVYEILERFAVLGKEIKITEHDININQRGVQADYTRDFMTILFSHSSVKSLLVWGFWENKHWRPEAAFFNADWSIRPHGEMWNDMIYTQWWTPASSLTTDALGATSQEGFLGTYKYTVTSGELERTGTFVIENSYESGIENTVVISLDETFPDAVAISSSIEGYLCDGEETTLSATLGNGLSYKWYLGEALLSDVTSEILASVAGEYTVKVSKGAMEITSPPLEIIVHEYPESVISVTGELTICETENVTLTAGSGPNLTFSWLKDGEAFNMFDSEITVNESGSYTLETTAIACASLSDPVVVSILSPTDPACVNSIQQDHNRSSVYPNPFKGTFTVDTKDIPTDSKFELYNGLGEMIYSHTLFQQNELLKISVENPGIYILCISGNEYKQSIILSSE